jgi:hypothetical protein
MFCLAEIMHDMGSKPMHETDPFPNDQTHDLSERLTYLEAQMQTIKHTLDRLEQQQSTTPLPQPSAPDLESLKYQLDRIESALNKAPSPTATQQREQPFVKKALLWFWHNC